MGIKLVVAGSREIRDREVVEEAMGRAEIAFGPVSEIVHGGARGVDSLADSIARDWDVEVTLFEPEWDEYGKAAGPLRNSEMAQYGDALVAVWDGESTGTKSMIQKAMAFGLDVLVIQQ